MFRNAFKHAKHHTNIKSLICFFCFSIFLLCMISVEALAEPTSILVSTPGPEPADAAASISTNFSVIAKSILTSLSSVPSLLAGIAYLLGLYMAVLGIFKIREHVENANQMALKNGAIQLGCGGALLSLPMITQAMVNSVGTDLSVSQSMLSPISAN